jgi:hypothetical protein
VNTLRINPAGGKPALCRAIGDCACELCGQVFVLPRPGEPRVCPRCRDELQAALPDAHEEFAAALAHVRMLGDGTGPYAGLRPAERREQLNALGTLLADLRYNPTAGEDAQVRASFRAMADQQVIDYIANAPADAAGYQAFALMAAAEELAGRLDGRRPSPDEDDESDVGDRWDAQA